ncbi:serine hydrolase-like protein 2 isoform X2 [Trichosurus vulpecula]|uniref:serine hydrolase-like protein 2 isoform X2 n=1 Tax=Trichosurus vulpecula TaxID=9337 RepID=UPI00186ABC81|nr:serine hydrolase-like protein 2 isoform X2 [Trichosurus vulpecula]
MGILSELKLSVPWGHIAAKAWGSLKGPPVLCLHGWLDNANSFDRLIPLLPQTFYYVAMDFGGHGLSSHHHPGFPYYQLDFVNEVCRVVTALKWKRFSLLTHSFGGVIGSMFSCVFPEMVDKLILLESSPFFLDTVEMNNLLTYRRRSIEHLLQVEAKQQRPPKVVRPEEMLQGFLKNNIQVGEECGKLLLERGTTKVPGGLVLNRDRRLGLSLGCQAQKHRHGEPWNVSGQQSDDNEQLHVGGGAGLTVERGLEGGKGLLSHGTFSLTTLGIR